MEITFDCKNAAFAYDKVAEVLLILDRIKLKVFEGERQGVIVDSNGNRVGKWSMEPDEDDDEDDEDEE